ncbi:MAG: hypothetical protein ACFCVF_01520 [Kineosporiaceae bacterium]
MPSRPRRQEPTLSGPLDALVAGSRDPARGRRAAEIADLVHRHLALPPESAVTVQQLACREPGCPPIETVIAVLGTPPRRWTLHHPLSEIDDAMVVDLVRPDDAPGDDHDH